MAILGNPDEEVGLLQQGVENERASSGLVARTVAAVLTIFLLSGCLVSLVAYSHFDSDDEVVGGVAEQEYPLNFLVVGDWGREGAYNQTLVAEQMGRVGRHLDIQFVISVGDNFYQAGLKGPKDPKFVNSFSNVYTAQSLQTQWFAVLGNHDYLGDTLLQIGDTLTLKDKRWFCQRSYQLKYSLCGPSHKGRCAKFVEIFFIDTTPFVDKYWGPDQKRTFDWRGVEPRQEYLDTQLQNLSMALGSSAATWKIVVGHHTIRSLGRHGDTPELVQHVLPILESHNVDLYINGHDHCLEHIKREDSSVHFVTSGAGSKSFQGIHEATSEDGLQFANDGQGFISMSMASKRLRIDFHDALGNVLYNLKLHK
jgi:tartrate-resistant acid phosphatase type 5